MSDPGRLALSRRGFLTLTIGGALAATLPAVTRRDRLVRRSLPVMGTIAEFGVVHHDPLRAEAAIDVAFGELTRIERMMTAFSPRSDVGRANAAAGVGEPVAVDPETAYVVAQSRAWADATAGAFDPCIGKAVTLWDVLHRHEPPPPRAVRALAERGLYRRLDVDRWHGAPVVRLRDRDAQLDLGGIAKGYAVDRAVDAVRGFGVTRAIVNVGGDLYALGRSEDGDPWKIGIQSPFDPSGLAGSLEVSDAAVATSGDYVRFFTWHGRRYHHLIDPRTAAPRLTPVHSVSVQAATCMMADGAATAIYGMPRTQADAVLARCAPGARAISLRDALGASAMAALDVPTRRG